MQAQALLPLLPLLTLLSPQPLLCLTPLAPLTGREEWSEEGHEARGVRPQANRQGQFAPWPWICL